MDVVAGGSWIEWGGPWGLAPGVIVLLTAIPAVALFWRGFLAGLAAPRRRILIMLRTGAAILIVILLFQPVLVRRVSVKSEQVVAVLHDDSQSMQVRNDDGRTRVARVADVLATKADAFYGALRSRFQVVEYAFGAGLRPIQSHGEIKGDQPETRIVPALLDTADELKHLALSAVVVLSDGGQQSPLDEAAREALAASGIPVYTVGVGEDTWRDLAVGDVALSRSFFDDAPTRITAQFTAAGLAGETLVAEVVQNGAVQASVERAIADDLVEQQVQLDVIPRAREWLEFTLRLRLKDSPEDQRDREYVTTNNTASVLLDHREKSYRILYFSGRPNWQYKFVRQALARDPELALSSLIRVSGAEKNFVFQGRDNTLGNPLFEGFKDTDELPRYDEAVFLRMGLAADELADGYPVTPEALYPFHLIIWSDIEADFFAPTQLRLTRDAVAERGASFLLLGGPRTLGSGDYAASLIEGMLPMMPGAEPRTGATTAPARIAPSTEGFLTGIWALGRERGDNDAAWAALPALPGYDLLSSPRIGASVLATGQTERQAEPFPFLLHHRFGHGKSAALATGETWPWHMGTEEGNPAHERLWRQLVRALVSTVPEPVTLTSAGAAPVSGTECTLTWSVKDELFKPVEGASLTARLISPKDEVTVALGERLDQPGTYEGTFTPAAPGLLRIVLEGTGAGGAPRTPVESALLVEADQREARSARFDPDLLQAIAQVTSGRYFALSQLDEVATAIAAAERSQGAVERIPLWHHPAFYVLLVSLLCVEWTLRRRWGQA